MITGLCVRSLAVRRAERLLFEGLDLTVRAGEVATITGPNGAGKTSLLRALAGLLAPASGSIVFMGAQGALEADEARRRDCHLLGHQDGLEPSRRAAEELRFWGRWMGGAPADARKAADRLGLAGILDLEVRKLSAGQKRRVALSRLLAAPRPLWLLDEPFAALDGRGRTMLTQLIGAHLAGGGLVVAATHEPLALAVRTVEIGAVSAAAALFGRELRLSFGRGGGPLLALGLFACLTAILPLGLGPAPGRLAAVAQGAAWAALTLSTLLGLERLFQRDLDNGALELLALGPLALEWVGLIKCLAQWLVNGAPLALAAPAAVIALGGAPGSAPMVIAAAAIGGVAFAFVGGVGAALALASRQGGVLIALIVLPLLAPPVIFGGAAIAAFAAGGAWAGDLALLTAYAAAALALAPVAMGAACRNALD